MNTILMGRNPAQLAFLSKALMDCSRLVASRIFGDLEPDTYAMLSPEDKKSLETAYEIWNQNGNPDQETLALIESGYFCGQAWVWAAYVAHLLDQAAREITTP